MKLTSLALLAFAAVSSAAASASALDALLAETSPKKESAKPSPANPVEVAPAAPVAEPPVAEPPVVELPVAEPTPVVPVEVPQAEAPQVESPESQVESPAPQVSESHVVPPHPKKPKLTGRPAKITSDTTIYNRKEGIASFEGHVYVDDEQYQMHADRVCLFLEGTNDLRRVVAIGHVAMTNETRRAYGAKATYSKKNGLVVLYSGDGITAEVRDESKGEEKIVRGKRIRFWIGAEQVEVDEADLTGAAPAGGADSLKKVLGK